MKVKFLIDECLSPKLVAIAVKEGYTESTCVSYRGWAGMKDWDLMRKVQDEDFVLVTNNAVDFRGKGKDNPGGLHSKEEVHNGLICLTSASHFVLADQEMVFLRAIVELQAIGDLMNKALEVHLNKEREMVPNCYEIPKKV